MSDRPDPWGHTRRPSPAPSTAQQDPQREQRLYGVNAIAAVFARRPGDIRKIWLAEARAPQFRELLKWCAAQRIGYRVVSDEDLRKLAASSHHEGIVADVRAPAMPGFETWLSSLPAGRQCLLWLDGVGNPHNLGAILRNAAHFGVRAILIPADATLAVSGAAARVAEGGAEVVPLIRLPAEEAAMASLRAVGFTLWATLVSGGEDLFAQTMPERLVYVMGAEQSGMDRRLAMRCDASVSIPGSGAVESLNVASATAVLLSAYARSP